MNKSVFAEYFSTKLMPIVSRITNQEHLRAIRDGISLTMPLLLIGSLFLIIAFPPMPTIALIVSPYTKFLLATANAIFQSTGLVASCAIAYFLSRSYKTDILVAQILSIVAFMLSFPLSKDGNISTSLMGSSGIFVAIIITIFVVEIQKLLVSKNITIKLPHGVPSAVARSFEALIPGLIVLTTIGIVNFLLNTTINLSIPTLLSKIVATPLLSIGNTMPATLSTILINHLLWMLGIHGSSLTNSIMGPIWLSLSQQNALAKADGVTLLPNISCTQFFSSFIHMGGSGATLPLVLLMLKAKSKQLKSLGKTSIWPGIFNINEPVIYCLPISMNPLMLIPFILAPLTIGIITYLAMDLNFIDRPYALIPWTTPVIFSGFLSTGDWKASLLQAMNLLISGAIYYPFLKYWDNAKLKEESADCSIVQKP